MNLIIDIADKLSKTPDYFIVSCFFLFMWGITLVLLFRRRDEAERRITQKKKINDWIQIARGYLAIPAFWYIFYSLR